MEYPNGRRNFTPWAWALIVSAAIVLVLIVWWVVAAESPAPTVVPGAGQTTTSPTNQPSQPSQPQQPTPQAQQQPSQPQNEQPVVVQREQPVNVYISPDKQPKVVVVPQGQQPPQAEQKYQRLSIPDQFRYNNQLWQPNGQAAATDSVQLKDTGLAVSGYEIYAQQNAQPPYDTLYLQTASGSGIYIVYTPSGQ